MTELAESIAETLEEIATVSRDGLDRPWLKADDLRARLAQIHLLATHAGVEADDLRLLADVNSQSDFSNQPEMLVTPPGAAAPAHPPDPPEDRPAAHAPDAAAG